LRSRTSILSIAGAVALAVVFTAAPASAATTAVVFDCQATPPVGSPAQLTLNIPVQSTAPETAAAGATFDAVVAPDPVAVPAEAAGATITNIRNIVLTAPVPANATLAAVTLTGGSNLGATPPTVAVANGVISLTIPGPIVGGTTFQLPALNLSLVASGTVDSTIQTKLGGTSYADPGLTFTANVHVFVFDLDVPASCFPNPSPVFTSTTIVAAPPSAVEE
jgi:dehydratase